MGGGAGDGVTLAFILPFSFGRGVVDSDEFRGRMGERLSKVTDSSQGQLCLVKDVGPYILLQLQPERE